MTCPDRPHDLDLLASGDPVAPHVTAHVDACDECAAEVALAQRIDRALAARATTTAPPDLVARALAQAKQTAPSRLATANVAADRPSRASGARGPSRRRLAGIAVAALMLALVAAISWTALRSPRLDSETVLAENDLAPTPAGETDAPLTPEADPLPSPDPLADADSQQTAEPETPQAAPAPRRTVRRAPPRRSAPVPQRSAPPPPRRAPDTVTPEALAAPDLVAEAEPTSEDIDRAQADLELAFSLIAGAQRQAGRAVRNEAGALSTTLDQTLPF